MNREKQTILVVEDNFINRAILSKIMSIDYNVIEAENGKEAIEIVNKSTGKIAAILLDIFMPVMDGYEVLSYLKERKIDYIPIVVMTGDTNNKTEESVLEMGAWDFVSKPYQPKILITRVKNAIARSQIESFRKIKHLAEHDNLTDIYNRRHFFETTEAMLLNLAKDTEKYAFVRMDINHFSWINKFWGEASGDSTLIAIANILKKHCEALSMATYGRIESDVFAFCIKYNEKELENLIDNIETECAKLINKYVVEPVFGVYVIEDKAVAPEDMYEFATLAARKCKSQYRYNTCFYNPKMSEALNIEQSIIKDMQHALDNDEFEVYFQPKYNVQTQTPYGSEALVRWNHPEKGMISPGVFIPVFENNGFIGKLDYYVWERTCRYIRKWLDEGIKVAPVSVNMSRAELSDPNLVNIISDLVKKYEIPHECFFLELTESAYMDNSIAMDELIKGFHEEGFTILMDDFGSGYSSLNTLKDIDIDILKVDLKFLSSDNNNNKGKKILASVVFMAEWLGLPVIMEGVETKEQFDYLKKIGAEYIQGYYFARPMPALEYEELIRDKVPVPAIGNQIITFEEFMK